MDDLISRAAALDAIVSATVFPDAEYIKNLCRNPANSEDWLGGVCDAINAVEDGKYYLTHYSCVVMIADPHHGSLGYADGDVLN